MRKDLARAVVLVSKGKTYGEAAAVVGLSRNQVAGAWHRATVKVSEATVAARSARVAKAKAELMRALLKDSSFNHKRLRALRAAKRREREKREVVCR